MKKSIFIGICLFQISLLSFSQNSINNYKYVIVPEAFGIFDEPNQYNLNALMEFLFNKHGFEAYMETEPPADINPNGSCNAMYASLLKDSGLFKTKLQVQLKDCFGKVVYTSEMGESREKDYKTAYQMALRDALKDLDELAYTYEPITTDSKKIVVAEVPVQTKSSETINPTVTQSSAPTRELVQMEEQPKVMKTPEPLATATSEDIDWLYAQPLDNGFQLIDTEPKKVMVLLNTALKDVYLVKDKNALVYKNGDQWIMSSSDATVKNEVLFIKF